MVYFRKMADNDAQWSDWEEEDINQLIQQQESEHENGKSAGKIFPRHFVSWAWNWFKS